MPNSAYFTVAADLKTIIDTEFAPEGFTAIFDNLHESLGRTRVDIGIAPLEDIVRSTDFLVQETMVEIRFYDLWKQEISPETLVNPTRITDFAERFRAALREFNQSRSGQMWFYNLLRIAYPNDPTGNKTRFVATVQALGNNAALIETTA